VLHQLDCTLGDMLPSHMDDIATALAGVEEKGQGQTFTGAIGERDSKVAISTSVQQWKPSPLIFIVLMPSVGSSLRHSSSMAKRIKRRTMRSMLFAAAGVFALLAIMPDGRVQLSRASVTI
jgi:hypothetical protein